MSTDRAMKRLQSVWGKSGVDRIPSPDEIKGTMAEPSSQSRRGRRSGRTARLELRVTPDEKKSVELLAMREGVSVNELFARMLALYVREHGRVELTSSKNA